MSHITVGAARFMVADAAGVRPSKNPYLKSSLKDRQVFINVADAVMCVGIGGGNYIELDFRNAAGLPGPPGPEGKQGPAGPPTEISGIDDVPGLPKAIDAAAQRDKNLGDLADKAEARANINAAKLGENDDILRLLGVNGNGIDFLAGSADIVSGSTVNIGEIFSIKVNISGSSTINNFGETANRVRFLKFYGVSTLVHNVNRIILPGLANITTGIGDTAIATSDASGIWTVRHYQRANGYPLITPLVFSGNTGSDDIPSGETRFFTIGNVGTAASLAYVPAGRKGRFRNLRVITSFAPGSGESWKFTLQKLFSDTNLTCTISGSGSNQASDLLNSVEFEAADRWCIKVVSSPGAPSMSNILFSMTFEAID